MKTTKYSEDQLPTFDMVQQFPVFILSLFPSLSGTTSTTSSLLTSELASWVSSLWDSRLTRPVLLMLT
jgi:hypothetical protein